MTFRKPKDFELLYSAQLENEDHMLARSLYAMQLRMIPNLAPGSPRFLYQWMVKVEDMILVSGVHPEIETNTFLVDAHNKEEIVDMFFDNEKHADLKVVD